MTSESIRKLVLNLAEPPDPYLMELYSQYKYHVDGCLQYYKFLYWIVRIQQPKLSLELGVWMGLASAYMASAAREYGGHVVGIDLNSHGVPRDQLNNMYGNYHYLVADSTSALASTRVKDLVNEYDSIGVVYQDSSHHYNASMREWELYSPMLCKDAVWVCDDITHSFYDKRVDPPGKGMVQYFAGLPGEKILFPEILHKGNTIGVVLCT